MAAITLSPAQGGPGDTVRVIGSGFAASSPLTFQFGRLDVDISFSEATSDGSGNVDGTFVVPRLPLGGFDSYDVTVTDAALNTATATFAMCWPKAGDGISTVPNQILAAAAETTGGSITPLAYIHHDGAHWIAWQDPSTLPYFVDPPADTQLASETFPPPANHTLNMTMVTDDGAVIVTYQLDTDYAWGFASGIDWVADSNHAVWYHNIFFQNWSKPILDLKLASDGTTIWVALLTRESVIYPHLSVDDGRAGYPSQIAQFVDLSTLTAGFTSFATSDATGYRRYYHNTDGPLETYTPDFPTSDGGDHTFGYWNPPRVVVFAGDSGGFTRIGTMDAKYCPGQSNDGGDGTDGYNNGSGLAGSNILGIPRRAQLAPQGNFFSGVSLAASPAQPGVCHLVWSEGGDYGQCGLGDGTSPAIWDGGPTDRGYRVGYSTWSSGGKSSEVDLFSSNVNRSDWWFPYEIADGFGTYYLYQVGYSWPDQDNFAASGLHALRNDSGSPVLFLAWQNVIRNPVDIDSYATVFPPAPPDPAGNPWMDNALVYGEPTVRMYDLSSGSAVLLQQISSDLLPTQAEVEYFYDPSQPSNSTYTGSGLVGPQAPDCLNGGLHGYNSNLGVQLLGSSIDRAFGVSFLYDDPLLTGQPVYLLAVPWGYKEAGGLGSGADWPMRAFYRVPADGSAPFDWLDGLRQVEFSILPEIFESGTIFATGGPQFGSYDFYSDPHNIWCPNAGYGTGDGFAANYGVQFDRICGNVWQSYELVPYSLGYVPSGIGTAGFYHDPAADTISYTSSFGDVVVLQVCRGCNPCPCESTGIHAFLRFGHNH